MNCKYLNSRPESRKRVDKRPGLFRRAMHVNVDHHWSLLDKSFDSVVMNIKSLQISLISKKYVRFQQVLVIRINASPNDE